MTEDLAHMEERSLLGFWLYILSDCVLFAGLFAVFAVLRGETYGGPSGSQLLNLPFVLLETTILLLSSYTMGFALVTKYRRAFLFVTLLLGLTFLGLEVSEFRALVLEGSGPARSAFLSSFFVLVGTHGLHVFAGSLWMITVMARMNMRRLKMLALFWHFLDIIWIFIFTIVYLLSAAL
jgi:cytochrome o ubiquinol oxidase subunit 3